MENKFPQHRIKVRTARQNLSLTKSSNAGPEAIKDAHSDLKTARKKRDNHVKDFMQSRRDASTELANKNKDEIQRQNASGTERRARAQANMQKQLGGQAVRYQQKQNIAQKNVTGAKSAGQKYQAQRSAEINRSKKIITHAQPIMKKLVNPYLRKNSVEHDMSTIEIISESCMTGLNEDMYFKVKILQKKNCFFIIL